MNETREQSVPGLSVVVISKDRLDALRACLDEVLQGDRCVSEVVLTLNGASPAVKTYAQELSVSDERVRVLETEDTSPSLARNRAASVARGDIVYFLDDDAIPRPEGLRALHAYLGENPEVAVCGGANVTPPGDPFFARVSGYVFESRWGAARARARYVALDSHLAPSSHLITCNLAVRREVFERGVRFPDTFAGEELVFFQRVAEKGFSFGYCRDAWVYHRRRSTPGAFLEQVFRYGVGRAERIRERCDSEQALFLVPVFFLLYLIALPVLLVASWLTVLPLALYAVVTLIVSLRFAFERSEPVLVVVLPPLFVGSHLSYAAGVVWGLARRWRRCAATERACGEAAGRNECRE